MTKVTRNIIILICLLFIAGCVHTSQNLVSNKQKADFLLNYARSVEGVGSWELIPSSVGEFYVASRQSNYFSDQDRKDLFAWNNEYAFLYIPDKNNRPIQILKSKKSFKVICLGNDGILGTTDDDIYIYNRQNLK